VESDGDGVPKRRNGLQGLTAAGRREVERVGAGMEERRACCGMWTISLPDEVLRGIRELDTWPAFQSSIRRRLARALREAGVPALLVGVVEIHPKRSRREGQELPHIHILFRGKAHRWQAWALPPERFDLMIRWAIWDADVLYLGRLTGSKVEPVKKSVARYLCSYLKKSSRFGGSDGEDWPDPRLIPRQWWFRSAEAKQLVQDLSAQLPPEFLSFLVDRRLTNSRGQLYHAWQAPIPDARAPSCWLIQFRSPWALFLCWEAYERAILGV
jgi:hypothetical protein